MKFLDYLFHGKELKAIGNYFKMLNGYSPTFTSFSGGVYEMDLTRTAINNFATHCSKLKPEIEGSALKSLEKTLQHKPKGNKRQRGTGRRRKGKIFWIYKRAKRNGYSA